MSSWSILTKYIYDVRYPCHKLILKRKKIEMREQTYRYGTIIHIFSYNYPQIGNKIGILVVIIHSSLNQITKKNSYTYDYQLELHVWYLSKAKNSISVLYPVTATLWRRYLFMWQQYTGPEYNAIFLKSNILYGSARPRQAYK